jgi:hypothetical protein
MSTLVALLRRREMPRDYPPTLIWETMAASFPFMIVGRIINLLNQVDEIAHSIGPTVRLPKSTPAGC